MESERNVTFKFSQASGAAAPEPSECMTEALQRLSESDEMQALVAEARAHGRKVVVHVFHSSDGHPILIHLGAAPQAA